MVYRLSSLRFHISFTNLVIISLKVSHLLFSSSSLSPSLAVLISSAVLSLYLNAVSLSFISHVMCSFCSSIPSPLFCLNFISIFCLQSENDDSCIVPTLYRPLSSPFTKNMIIFSKPHIFHFDLSIVSFHASSKFSQ